MKPYIESRIKNKKKRELFSRTHVFRIETQKIILRECSQFMQSFCSCTTMLNAENTENAARKENYNGKAQPWNESKSSLYQQQ